MIMNTTYLDRFQTAVRISSYRPNDANWDALLTIVLEIWDAARQHNLDPILDDWLEGLSEEDRRHVADEGWNEPDVSSLAACLDLLVFIDSMSYSLHTCTMPCVYFGGNDETF